MKKIFSLLFFVLLIQQSFCQREIFDIATYTPPKGWQKNEKTSLVSYTNINTTTGTFCILAIYTSTPSTGNAQKDFKQQWKDLVVIPYKADANPKTETQVADGWETITGAALVKSGGIDSYIFLTVFSGYGKTTCVLANLNDQSYLTAVDDLLQNLSLDKTTTKPQTTNVINASTKATPGKFGKVLYSIPPGWKEQQYQNGVLITPQGLPAGENLVIQLMEPMIFSGSLEQALEKSYDQACALLQVTKMREVSGLNYNALSPKRSFRGWEYIRCSGGIKVNNGTDYPDEYGLDLFVIKINNRYERVAVRKSRNNCNLSRYYPSDRLNYYNAIEEFYFSLKFTDWQEPVITTASIKGNGIVGVWRGIALRTGIPTSGGSGAQYKVVSAIFFSNGQAYFGNFPGEGLDDLNSWVKAENNRRDWGTYTYSNGKGVLKLPYAQIPLRMAPGKLILTTMKTDHAYIKLNPVDGATFNGTYVLSEWNGMIPTITFSADGKFTDKGAMWVLYHEYVECMNNGKNPGSGTYEVKNHSVIFNYTDGRKIKIAFLGIDYDKKNRNPATLSLSSNEDVLSLKR